MSDSANKKSTALKCLNELSDFVDFEKLYGTDSHCSRVFHAVCTQKIFGVISAHDASLSDRENDERLAELLLKLHENGLSAIQIASREEKLLNRGFFCTYSSDVDKTKDLFLSLGKNFNQARVAVYDNRNIRVLNVDGTVFKMFNIETLEPAHLKKIWNAMLDSKATSLESGFLSGSPLQFCGPMYESVGLRSDVPVNLVKRLYQKSSALLRHRPFENAGASQV